MTFCFEPIGIVHSCFKEKFGIPRQAGLIPEAEGILEMLPPYNRAEAFREIEGYSHLWITFVFHAVQGRTNVSGGRTPGETAAQGGTNAPCMDAQMSRETGGRERPAEDRTPEATTAPPTQWSPTVRPPRLGGNRRVGVFASRSPFRPNPIGLSLVKLLSVDLTSPRITLRLGGIDLLDGTPVLDIKPYLPYADVASNARGGFAPAPPGGPLTVEFSVAAQRFLENMQQKQAAHLRSLIQQILRHDPRPAYLHDNPSRREFGMRLYDLNIRWRVEAEQVLITVMESHNDPAPTQ